MSVGDLIPWRNRNAVSERAKRDPVFALHDQVNGLFENFMRGMDLPWTCRERGTGWLSGWPSVEVKEDDKRFYVEAELPGLEQKDVEVLLSDDVLTIRGEKRIDQEDAKRHYSERYFGQFERQIPLSAEVEPDNVKAKFKNGVLKVEIPKSPNARERARRIPISS
jgi:HSP20 family protein